MPDPAPFGFRNVSPGEKRAGVRAVFEAAAPGYDRMNDVMSWTLHRWWKKQMIARMIEARPSRLLDLAGGTGDIALGVARADPKVRIRLCDPGMAMIDQGRRRPGAEGVRWICAEAEGLPFSAESFDGCSLAFGLRNVTDPKRCLNEIARVIAPGGHLWILELGHVDAPVLRRIYDFYSMAIIPRLGSILTGQADPYRYLVESIRRFADKYRVMEWIEAAGFTDVTCEDWSVGVVNYYHARKAG